jgi:hypothetical protein
MSTPIVPLAPGRLSTTTVCPQRSLSFCATARAVISVPPPGGNGTINLIGRAGKAEPGPDDAGAGAAANAVAAAMSKTPRRI